MAMDLKEIENFIKEAMPDAIVEIQDLAGDGNHYSATVTSSQFSGKSKIEQHKMVYNSLKGKMGNELHGKISISDGLGPFSIGLGLDVNRGTWRDFDDVYLHLPGIDRADLSLRSESGVVYVGINEREHPVPFDRPAKASKVEAKLEKDVLKLTFPQLDSFKDLIMPIVPL